MGEIEIYYSEPVASRRPQPTHDKPEPSWVGAAKIGTWVLNTALALRAAARFRPVQYLAAVIFIVASAGTIVAVSVILAILFVSVSANDQHPLLLMMFGPAGAWLVASPIIGILRSSFNRRRTCSLPLSVLRFMGSPARESLRAWDGIFFGVDKKIGRVISIPLVWLLRKPHRVLIVAVVLGIIALLIAYGLLIPGQMVAWANQYGRGFKFVAGSGFGMVLILGLLMTIAAITYGLLIVYVWFRSALVAVPFLIIFLLARAEEFSSLAQFTDPVIRLVTYLPPGLAEAYNQPVESVPSAILVNLSRTFIGNPEYPTTIGMILTGVLIGWLPYVLEQLDKPTPRDVVARHGWGAATEQAQKTRAHLVFVNALWGGGLAVFFFALAPVQYLFSSLEKTGFYTFLFIVIPVGTCALILRAIVKKVRKSGRITRPQPLDMSAEEIAGGIGAPGSVPLIAKDFSPLARLLSEAQRRRNPVPVDEAAAI